MDSYFLSQIFGSCALAFRVGSHFVQARFPDSFTMRKVVVPTHAVSALSYALNNAPIPAIAYAGACARSALLSTRFGERHKNALATLNILGVGAASVLLYEKPSDCLALLGTIFATAADYQGQGRYQRLPYFITRAFVWIPMAALNRNWAMLAADCASFLLSALSIYRHDIKKCGWPEQELC